MKREVGDLSLDKMPNLQLFRYGLGEDGPVPIYTSKTKYTALILNLGNFIRGRKKTANFIRGRKKTAPSAFSDYIEYDSSGDSRGALIKSIAQSKSHLFMLCEATNVTQGEKDFLYARGWQTIQNNSGDILIGSRTNLVPVRLARGYTPRLHLRGGEGGGRCRGRGGGVGKTTVGKELKRGDQEGKAEKTGKMKGGRVGGWEMKAKNGWFRGGLGRGYLS